METLDGVELSDKMYDVGSVRLHGMEAGEGPLVVLLHGFPEFWYCWRRQAPDLVRAGFRVIAIDLRGYNLSDKPKGVSSYRVEHLADDVAGLIKSAGETKAHVVGHDWGAVVAWFFAMRHPNLLDRLAILNVPHPVRMQEGWRTWSQLKKSWYVFFFQIPWLPERGFRANHYHSLRVVFRRDPCRPGAYSEGDIDRYVEAFQQPGCLTSAINYYRAIIRTAPSARVRLLRRIEAPVLVLWGELDRYLNKELADPPTEWVPNARVIRYPQASHWVQVDEAENVNRELIEFLAAR